MSEVEDKLRHQQKQSLELMKKNQIYETEIENLKQEIIDLKGAIETYRLHLKNSTRAAEI